MTRIRVLVVDDSVVIRRLVTDALASDPELEVIGTAVNGKAALTKIDQLNPDIVTLDVEMPEMDGVETLKHIRKTRPKLPVIMFSTLTVRGAVVTLDALAAGASDYVAKPANVGSTVVAQERIRQELIPKLKALCGGGRPSRTLTMVRPRQTTTPRAARSGPPSRVDIVAIGVSTGGPNALAAILPQLPVDFPVPVVIVQHMPALFTKLLAERLDANAPLSVKEGVAGAPLAPGAIWIAPGGLHMTLRQDKTQVRLATNEDPPVNSCRPAVDVLFTSVAHTYGPRALAVVLTGMGQDGMRGCEHIVDAGGQVLAQDEASSVVWGMPGFVANAGLADRVLPLSTIAAEIVRRVREGRELRPRIFPAAS